jgi:hypothetical protein
MKIKIRAETNEIETEWINETKSWFFGSISRINSTLDKLTKRGRWHKWIKLEVKNVDTTKDNIEVPRITKQYFETLYSKKLEKSRRNG